MAEDSESVPLTYYQILVGDNLQVSFDNNAENNYWSFHDGSSLPNVSGWHVCELAILRHLTGRSLPMND